MSVAEVCGPSPQDGCHAGPRSGIHASTEPDPPADPPKKTIAAKYQRNSREFQDNCNSHNSKGNPMATYLELKQKAEKLMQEAEEMRIKELNDVIADIKGKIAAYGLTAQDLGLPGAPRRRRAPSPKAAPTVKYRGPNGQTWSGGRGRKPQWVVDALASGKKLEDFAAN